MRSNVRYYDRDGQEIDWTVWAKTFEDPECRRVMLDTGSGWSVSTVWLGLDHNFDPQGPPHIFETLAEKTGDEYELMRRYSTEADARSGHAKILNLITDGMGLEAIDSELGA